MLNLLGYLGPAGTFSEELAVKYAAGTSWQPKPYSTIDQIFSAVEKGEVAQAVVPVENSLEGTVNLTLDLLSKDSPVMIKGELLLKVQHCLLTRPGQKISGIVEVYSHPQALAQCRLFLDRTIPEASRISTISTAEAVGLVARSAGKAVIASRRAARLYNLEVLRANIQDEASNVTRFLLLALEDAPPTGYDKTSVLLGLPDRPGSLHAALGIFAGHKLNLTKIESRPIRGDLGKYIFFLDVEGHRKERSLNQALAELSEIALFVRILGSYPLARQTFL
jgi:prephenate dehydratase